MDFKAFISGCAGTSLSDEERAFFAEARPCGLILFARNCSSPEQLRTLVTDFRDAVESDEALVLIDQEGGRVQRLRPPYWREMPPARAYGELYADDPLGAMAAAFAGARLIAAELHDARHHRQLHAGSRRAAAWRARHHRRSRLQLGSRHRHRFGARRGRRNAGRWSFAGDQARAGPWPRAGRQPSVPAAHRRVGGRANRGRLPAVHGAVRRPARHDRPCPLAGLR